MVESERANWTYARRLPIVGTLFYPILLVMPKCQTRAFFQTVAEVKLIAQLMLKSLHFFTTGNALMLVRGELQDPLWVIPMARDMFERMYEMAVGQPYGFMYVDARKQRYFASFKNEFIPKRIEVQLKQNARKLKSRTLEIQICFLFSGLWFSRVITPTKHGICFFHSLWCLGQIIRQIQVTTHAKCLNCQKDKFLQNSSF